MTGAIHGDEYVYRVLTSAMVTPVIAAIRLEPVAEPLPFRAGQYVLLLDTAFRIPPRSYSMANAPRADGTISLLITLVAEGVTSTWATRLKRYDEVLLEGPFGTFTPAAGQSGPMLLLGAGSGLAPNRALADEAISAGVPRPVTLMFSGRTTDHLIDDAQLRRWDREHEGFTYRAALTRVGAAEFHDRLPVLLPTLFDELAGWEVFAAGPPGFVAGCAEVAATLGAATIHTEEFFADPAP